MGVNLHTAQAQVYKELFVDQKFRYVTACCSRGFGKSYLAATAAVTAVFELLELDESIPNKNVYIIAPTFDQVRDIYFPLLVNDFGIDRYTTRYPSADTGKFKFPKGVELRLVSFESVERLRGKGCYFAVLDEISSWIKKPGAKEAWQGIIQPLITTRWSPQRAADVGSRSPGRALIISTPKGYNFFYDMCMYSQTDDQWGFYHFDYTKSPFLDPEEIERIKHTLDPIEFATEYMASFEDSGNNVFYCFDRQKHITDEVGDFRDDEDIHCAIDFNVGIQATSFFAVRGKQMHFIDEFKGHPDTETLAKSIAERFKGHKIYAYPDPSGRARKTSAAVGRTDFSILESYGIRCRAHKAAPPIIDSAAAVNRKLLSAAGDIEMFVHPRCKGTIKSLERTAWVDKNPDTATIDKSEGVEHFSDGVRYATEYLFPVQSGTKKTVRGFGF